MQAITIDLIRKHLREAQSKTRLDYELEVQRELNNQLDLRIESTPSPTNDDYCTIYHDAPDGETHVVSGAKDRTIATLLVTHLAELVHADLVQAPVVIPQYRKIITYDRVTGDFACYLDGQSVGYAPTYIAAETRLNELVYNLLTRAA